MIPRSFRHPYPDEDMIIYQDRLREHSEMFDSGIEQYMRLVFCTVFCTLSICACVGIATLLLVWVYG